MNFDDVAMIKRLLVYNVTVFKQEMLANRPFSSNLSPRTGERFNLTMSEQAPSKKEEKKIHLPVFQQIISSSTEMF